MMPADFFLFKHFLEMIMIPLALFNKTATYF